MASSDESIESNGARHHRRRGVGRHPSYELHRSCDRDTHATIDTLGSISNNNHHSPNNHNGIKSSNNNNNSSTDDDDDDTDFALAPDLAERLVKRTEARVSQVVASSKFVRTNCTLGSIPRFYKEDLVLGELIAFGGFSNVYGIQRFTVDSALTEEPKDNYNGNDNTNGNTNGNTNDNGNINGNINENSNNNNSHNSNHNNNNNNSHNNNNNNNHTKPQEQFVIKHLNPKLAFNPKKLVVGAKDLVMEAHFLSAFDHEHIIRLRGWAAEGIAGFASTGRADGFFLILDRLATTLSKRISRWRGDEASRKSLTKGRQAAKNRLFLVRLGAAINIASAVAYLHERRILFRDLKPANIGFDRENVLKLFDFGLAVEIPHNDDPETTFKLAGNTGTSRYMAVEVIRKDPYNLKADVFSYSILLWEIMALSKPYEGLLGPQVKETVSLFGERPTIPRSWPVAIRRLLRKGWSESISNRPTMEEVLETLTRLSEASSKQGGKFF